jgi:glutamate formiminotransferase / 5-formyltetrahydrofolate cyclo-ligase
LINTLSLAASQIAEVSARRGGTAPYTSRMTRLVECVPNVSEGRRPQVVDAIAEAITRAPGAHLLDRTSDVDHNRSVLTFAGEEAAVAEAMENALGAAIARIDMTAHEGRHPRLGAVDVIPFVPLGDTTMDDCVALARRFGAHVADHFDLPVYLYAAAASRPERRVLADIRRPQFEGLAAMMAAPGGEPDFGPPTPHPTAGAVVIGARPFLIAWNINLESADVALAKRIAGAIRERDGGLPRVQALGLLLDDLGVAQVSMNLLDTSITPIWRVWETVESLAREAGVALRESELIGLAPQSAILSAADRAGVPADAPLEARLAEGAAAVRIRAFTPDMALELRLAAAAG